MPITSKLTIRRHNLPHWQQGGNVYFITFRSAIGDLSPTERSVVMECIMFSNAKDYDLLASVVMSNHVHLLLQPREKTPGTWYDLSDFLKRIKGISARKINKMLGTGGKVWQAESFDRIIRDDDELIEKWNYIINNPVKAGLVSKPDEYPYCFSSHNKW